MTARRRHVLVALALVSVAPLPGCARGCTSSRPPIHLNPSMDDQPKVLAQTASKFFYDGAAMRQPVPGTIPIGGLKEDAAFFTGKHWWIPGAVEPAYLTDGFGTGKQERRLDAFGNQREPAAWERKQVLQAVTVTIPHRQ